MADAPSGGGKWETFEIVIIVILIGGILVRLTGTSLSGTRSTNTKAPTTTQTVTTPATPNDICGLTTSAPLANQKVKGSVTISGTINGCDWMPVNGVALYAQVIDKNGKPVSDYIHVPAQNVVDSTASFSMTIALYNQPASGSGTVIFIPVRPVSTKGGVSARIPITFSR